MRIFPKDWSLSDKLMITFLFIGFIVGVIVILLSGCSSSAHCSLEVM